MRRRSQPNLGESVIRIYEKTIQTIFETAGQIVLDILGTIFGW